MPQASQSLEISYESVKSEPTIHDSLVGPEIPTDGIKPDSPFLALPHVIVDDLMPRLGPSVFCVYLALYRASWGWRRNHVLTSTRALAKQVGLNTDTVNEALHTLREECLLIKGEERGPKGTVYVVRLPAGSQTAESTVQKSRTVPYGNSEQYRTEIPNSTVASGQRYISSVEDALSVRTSSEKSEKSNTPKLLFKESLKKEKEKKKRKTLQLQTQSKNKQPESDQKQPKSDQKPETEIGLEAEILDVLLDWALSDSFHRQNLQRRTPEKQKAYVRRNQEKISQDSGIAIEDLRGRLRCCHQWGML